VLFIGAALALVSTQAASLKSPGGLSVRVDPKNGDYQISAKQPAWNFGGSLNVPLKDIATSNGQDAEGSFRQIP
jgi:hypothetical protein